jgi:hypothetical protein
MQVEEKANKLIVKLLRDTLSGKLEWAEGSAPRVLTETTNDRIPLYLSTRLGTRTIAVYQRRWEDYDDEHGRFAWHERPGLCVFEAEAKKPAWEYEHYSPALRDLISTAREQAVGVDGLLDELLAEN